MTLATILSNEAQARQIHQHPWKQTPTAVKANMDFIARLHISYLFQ